MRWDRLFADLEAQMDAAEQAELAAEVADRTRREHALTGLFDRLRQVVGEPIELTVAGVGPLAGRLGRVGNGWLLLESVGRPDAVVTRAGLVAIRDLPTGRAQVSVVGAVAARLDLGHVLRALARDRAAVTVVGRDASRWTGTIDRVGADFIDLAEHPVDEPRRLGRVRAVQTIQTDVIAVVRSAIV